VAEAPAVQPSAEEAIPVAAKPAASAAVSHAPQAAAPEEHWNTAIGPIVLVVFLAIIIAAYLLGRAGVLFP